MPRLLLAAVLLVVAPAAAADPVVEPFESPARFALPKAQATAAVVPGKVGNAIHFRFDKDAKSVFAVSRARGTPDWDAAAGFSFWVKGDGADGFGGLQFIHAEDYAARYDFAFPVSGTDWKKVTVAWADLVPVTAAAGPLDPAGAFRPSKLAGPWVGKWWYWGDYPATSFALDEFRLEPALDRPAADPKPAGPPLARTLAKLRAGRPITVVTMGDSLTDFRHWANRPVAWPNLFRDAAKAKYQSAVTVVNPAIGGTQLKQNLVLIPRWLPAAPDLVTVCFGGNDWDGGMRGPAFRAATADAVDRVRRLTGGKADVLLMTTVPGLERWDTYAELAEAVRAAAADRNAGLADTAAAFHATAAGDRAKLFAWDKVHLGAAGHALVAETVLTAVEAGGK